MPSKPTLPRDEIEVVFDEVMVELFGPDPRLLRKYGYPPDLQDAAVQNRLAAS